MSVRPTKALSDVYGKIQQLLLSFPHNLCDAQQLFDHYHGIFEAFKNAANILILVQREPARIESSGTIPTNLGQLEKQLDLILSENGFDDTCFKVELLAHFLDRDEGFQDKERPKKTRPSEWVQDPFLVLKADSGHDILLESSTFSRYNSHQAGDQLIADRIAAQTKFLLKPLPVYLEGGNILVGDDFCLIGSDVLEKNLIVSDESSGLLQIENQIRNALGVEQIVWIQNIEDSCSPLAPSPVSLAKFMHIDMYITLGGKLSNGKELIFVAEISELSGWNVHPCMLNDLKDFLQSVADNLSKKQNSSIEFHVERIPIILFNSGEDIVMSYNNCLIERYSNHKNVYLPKFAAEEELNGERIIAIENMVKMSFERFGYCVQMVDFDGYFNYLARKFGALRCVTKVLNRLSN